MIRHVTCSALRGLGLVGLLAVAWGFTAAGRQVGTPVPEAAAVALRGGVDICSFENSLTCPNGPTEDKKGFDCRAKNVLQAATGGTQYEVLPVAYCGGTEYCSVYTNPSNKKCGVE